MIRKLLNPFEHGLHTAEVIGLEAVAFLGVLAVGAAVVKGMFGSHTEQTSKS